MTPDRSRPPLTERGHQGSVARSAFVVVAIAALALLAWKLATVFILVFAGVIVATSLRALAAPLERRAGVSRRFAFAIAAIFVVAMLAATAWLIGDRLAAQLGDLRAKLPEALGALFRWLQSHPPGRAILDAWDSAKAGELPWAQIANIATITLEALGYALLIVVVGVFLGAEPDQYRRGLVRLFPVDYRHRADEALIASGHALKRWLLGQGISMLFVGIATAAGLAVLGMPLALSLGLIAGLLDFVPFFGPLVSGLLIVLFAFTQGPTQALYVAGLCALIQQIEANVLMPFVQRWAVALPPVLAIIAGIAFGLLFGIVGLLFATPLMVVVMVLVQKLYVESVLEANPAAAALSSRPH